MLDHTSVQSLITSRLAHKVSTRNRGRRRRLSYHPISILEFNGQYNRRLREGDIDHEFELLQEYSAKLYEEKSRSIGQLEINKPRNRFVDIVPCTCVRRGNSRLWIKGSDDGESAIISSFQTMTHW